MSFPDPPIVDAHAHILTHRMPLRPDAWAHPDYEYPVEAWLADMDAQGIAFGVLAAASLYGDYNDYTLWALGQHKRLRSTVVLDPATDVRTLKAMRDQGVVGVRLQWKVDAIPPDMRGYEYAKFLNRLADLGMHVELNCSGPQLHRVLSELEDRGIRVMVDHFGMLRSPGGMDGDGFRTMLASVAKGSTWVKISAGFRLEPEQRRPCADRLLAEAGPERLVWGSDAPFVGMEDKIDYPGTVAMFHQLVPDPAVRRRISDTALRFYFY